MNENWLLDTHGDPLGKTRDIIKQVWIGIGLEGMLVTASVGSSWHAAARYITEPAVLDEVNPFQPLMEMNIAALVPATLAGHPGARIGALLRPCELRALVEIAKHTPFDHSNLLTFSVDCLGTLPADEYQWRLQRLESTHIPGATESDTAPAGDLAQEALQFARQGGILPYRFRSPCQVCDAPAASQATFNIKVLGLPVRQTILLSVTDPQISQRLPLAGLTNGLAEHALVAQHERILAKMHERHTLRLERLNESLGSLLPSGIDDVIRRLESCGSCQLCMEACPICAVDPPSRDESGHYKREEVMCWLVSCAGCGMCEQACPQNLPIAAIFGQVRRKLAEEIGYTPGRSMDEPFPLPLS